MKPKSPADHPQFSTHKNYLSHMRLISKGLSLSCDNRISSKIPISDVAFKKVKLIKFTIGSMKSEYETIIQQYPEYAAVCVSWIPVKAYYVIFNLIILLEYLDALTILKNDDYARMLSTEVFWAIFPVGSPPEIIKNIEKKLLELITERVEENKKGHYSSIIKLLINIYGFGFHKGIDKKISIGKYIETEFKNNIAKLILADVKNQERFLPQEYTIDSQNKIIKDLHGNIIYKE